MPRRFVVARSRIEKEDGSVLLVERSVEHPDAPETKDVVQADLAFNFRLISPANGTKVATSFVYANMTCIGGWVPSWLVNKTNPTVSVEEIERIREICTGE